MEHEKLQQNCPAPQRRWLHGSPGSARAGGTATAAAVSNRAKRIDGSFLFTAVLLSVPVGVVPPVHYAMGRRRRRTGEVRAYGSKYPSCVRSCSPPRTS